ncbi:hypothetical protein JCM8097_005900 [Rhodosporidiobolus ruineniae]
MSYASSTSSSDAHSDFDGPFPSFCTSTVASGTTSPSSSLASIGSVFDVEEQYLTLKRSTDSFVHTLLKNKRENETALRAWRMRCDSLEAEVLRLAALVSTLTDERDEAVKRYEATQPTVCDEVQTDALSSSPSSPSLPSAVGNGCSCSPDCAAPTPCVWTGSSWEPVPPPSRPMIDPSKPMSRQNPPPCNSYFLLGHCDVPRCRFEHGYELTEEQVSEMGRGAKHHVCNAIRNGVPCPDGDECIYGHTCPRGPSCGRERCGFNDEQHKVIPTPRPVLRRR